MENNLKAKLNADMRQAMKDKDTVKRDTIRLTLADIKNAEIAKRGELSDSDILGILSKEMKQHQESIEAFRAGNRADLAEKEEAELAIIEHYLPKQLSRDEIMAIAKKIVEETGASGPSDKGKVMPKMVTELKGQADGKVINEVVTELLNA